jgi:hypothetical protein
MKIAHLCRSRTLLMSAAAGLLLGSLVAATGHMSHDHGSQADCAEPILRCASKVTPSFAPDGSLWLAFTAAGRVLIARSNDLGQSFTTPIALNQEPLDLDWGPDARPKLAITPDGRAFVAFAVFKNQAYDGQVLYTRSLEGGRTFAPPRPITTDPESQRFEAIALDADGSLFTAWLDKRRRAAAKANNETYVGAALAFTWATENGAGMSETNIAHEHTCECCRLAVAFAAPGRPAIAFRNVFEGGVRDHAITTFVDRRTPGPVYRVSKDDWQTDVCPHHGPTLAISPTGSYHVAWFTNAPTRKGLFYARSVDGGRSFSDPIPIGRAERAPSHPSVLAAQAALWLAWKEFDGDKTAVWMMVSRNDGAAWSAPKRMAETGDSSDHPLLVSNGSDVFLSWHSKAEGYRLIGLGDTR